MYEVQVLEASELILERLTYDYSYTVYTATTDCGNSYIQGVR